MKPVAPVTKYCMRILLGETGLHLFLSKGLGATLRAYPERGTPGVEPSP